MSPRFTPPLAILSCAVFVGSSWLIGCAGDSDDPSEVADCVPACSSPTPTCQADGTCAGCGTTGCSAGQSCNSSSGLCLLDADPCANINCQPGWVCDPATQLCGPACDVVAQDCEDPGDRCTVLANDALGCEPSGSVLAGQTCGASGTDDCTKGTLCAGSAGSGYTCMDLCDASSCTGCSSGTGCIGLGDSQGNPIEGAGVCIDLGTSCDVMAQDCNAGTEKCTLATMCDDYECVPLTGTKAVGETCNPMNDDCDAGLICLQMGPACFKFCTSHADCPAGQQCSGFAETVSVGHCMAGH